jgi:kynureninase
MGHSAPFDFSPTYAPGDGIAQFLCGTPPMLSMTALEAALDLWLRVDLETVWRKSLVLSELLIRLVDERGADLGLSIASPRDPRERGSHVAIRHAQGYRIMRALIDRGVIGDFRPPDLMRLALTPLYTRFVDIWDAVDRLVAVVADRAYEAPEYGQRLPVT